jgi:methyl-accepting chemotaxis protein
VRVTLTTKFVLGSLVVGGAVVLFPVLIGWMGIEMAPWAAPFVALGAGAAIGFVLSRDMAHAFQGLRVATEQISRGNLATRLVVPEDGRFPDETVALARSIQGMAASLRELVEHVQRTAERVSRSARELSASVEGANAKNASISAAVAVLSESVTEQQTLLQGANKLVHEISTTVERNADRAREAFGFAAEANSRR